MNHRSAASHHPTSGGEMDFSLTSEQQAFRQTVRAWLKENIPHEWKHLGSSEIPRLEAYELLREWQRKLYDAGSDLASLQTRAVKDGDHWVLNGQKVWTSFAQVAHWMMLLARTDPQAPRHKGITYFLLDMKLPGVVVKPLRQITGEAEFNEVFLDNVRVHESEVLGGVNNGWQVGITTLMYERLTLGFGLQMRLRIAFDSLIELARRMEKHG